MCALLWDKHGLLPEQVYKLDRWKVRHVILAQKDDKGTLILRATRKPRPANPSHKERFWAWARKRGPFSEAEIERMYADWQGAEAKKKARLEEFRKKPKGRKR